MVKLQLLWQGLRRPSAEGLRPWAFGLGPWAWAPKPCLWAPKLCLWAPIFSWCGVCVCVCVFSRLFLVWCAGMFVFWCGVLVFVLGVVCGFVSSFLLGVVCGYVFVLVWCVGMFYPWCGVWLFCFLGVGLGWLGWACAWNAHERVLGSPSCPQNDPSGHLLVNLGFCLKQ